MHDFGMYEANLLRNIPKEMQEVHRWTGYAVVEESGNRKKKPVNLRTLAATEWQKSENLLSMREALPFLGKTTQAYGQTVTVEYLGFVSGAGWFFIDLDNHDGGQTPAELLEAVQDRFKDTYWETSVSGNGLHIIGKYYGVELTGNNPENGSPYYGKIELYTAGRGAMITGNTGDLPRPADELPVYTDAVKEIHSRFIAAPQRAENSPTRAPWDGRRNWTPEESRRYLEENLEDILGYFSSECGYDDWLRVGMALHYEGFPVDVFDRWSSTAQNYPGSEEIEKKYNSFRDASTHPRTGATLIWEAKQKGWIPPRPSWAAGSPENFTDSRKKKPRLDIPMLEMVLEGLGINIRRNEITTDTECTIPEGSELAKKHGRKNFQDKLAIILHSELGEQFSNCTISVLEGYLSVIADKNSYNPVRDWLEGLQWDGKDHFQELYNILGLLPEDNLSRILIQKWLMQGVALQHNTGSNGLSPDGMLVLIGEQGCGKTSLLRALGVYPEKEWFREGQSINDRDKDTLRRVVTTWICELGELPSTLKSDIDKLKAFITQGYDEYRLPYGRADVRHPRHVNLCGTANEEQFLIDETGNRRFWVVPVRRRNTQAERDALNVEQIWAQAAAMLKEQGVSSYRVLEDDLREMLTARNSEHRKPLKGEQEVRDILDNPGPNTEIAWQTITEWKEGYRELSKYSSVNIGRVLKVLGVEQNRTANGRLYPLPRYKFTHTGVPTYAASDLGLNDLEDPL